MADDICHPERRPQACTSSAGMHVIRMLSAGMYVIRTSSAALLMVSIDLNYLSTMTGTGY